MNVDILMINFQTTNTKPIKENKYNFTSLIENTSSEKASVKRNDKPSHRRGDDICKSLM